MKYKFDGYNWLVRFDRGDKLITGLEQLARQEKIDGAWISGIGTASSATVGFYDFDKKDYEFKTFNQPLEIISLQGNLSWADNTPVLHLHGTFSGKDLAAFGGHVKEVTVSGTCELLVHRWYNEALQRRLDDESGLKLLDL